MLREIVVNHVRGYLTKRTNGLYMVTAFQPIIAEVVGAGREDAYFRYGDPMAFNNITPEFIEGVGVEPPKDNLVSHKIIFHGGKTPHTHLLWIDSYDLYAIEGLYPNRGLIEHVCPWFISKLFGIKDLEGFTNIYFQGEILWT